MRRKNANNQNPHYYSDRLRRKFDTVTMAPAAVVEAPTGYGKTTAVRDYIGAAVERGEDVYWLTAVDEAPMALYRRFCRKIGILDARAGARLWEIDFPNAFTIGEACDAIRSINCTKTTWFIIDDFQFFIDVLPPSFLEALLDHDCAGLRVIIIIQSMGQHYMSAVVSRGVPYFTVSDLRWDADDVRRYFNQSGAFVTNETAVEIQRFTDGWIIAVHLQLCSFLETGSFSDAAVYQLMDHMIWNKLSYDQQLFFLRVSPFKTFSARQICGVLKCADIPDYVQDALSLPFIRFNADENRYEPHDVLIEFLKTKRRDRGEAFERECVATAGDLCRSDGRLAEALYFYAMIKDYERILSLDLRKFVSAETNGGAFSDIALDITRHCPLAARRKYPHSMMCVAWAIRLSDDEALFESLLGEIDGYIPADGALRADWLLLSAYLKFPRLDEMLRAARMAAGMFNGAVSQVIMPEAPWAMYEYLQLTAFHIEISAVDGEADMLEDFIAVYSRLTGGPGYGADALFRAELAYLRCETSKAEIFAYKAMSLAGVKRQKIIQIGAARILASIALLKADADGWQQALNAFEQAASGSEQNTSVFRAVLDVVRSALLAELRDYSRIAEWLQNLDYTSVADRLQNPEYAPGKLPVSISKNALAVYMLCLIGRQDFARLVGFLQSLPLERYTVLSKHIHFFLMAVGFSSLGDRPQAAACLERSAKEALPDGMYHYFAGFSRLLQGLSDELISSVYPRYVNMFNDYKEQYVTGWFTLHNAIVGGELPDGLTAREHEIALLAADGLRNNEIAEMLCVSENTVRAHLRSIYQKLHIDRRAKLAEKLR